MSQPPVVALPPMADAVRAILVDLRCYEIGRRTHRNVLMARNTVNPANFVAEQSLTLKGSAAVSGKSHTIQGTDGNTVTLMTATAPLRVRVTRDTGVLDLGPQTMLVLTSEILSLQIENEAEAEVDVQLIHF